MMFVLNIEEHQWFFLRVITAQCGWKERDDVVFVRKSEDIVHIISHCEYCRTLFKTFFSGREKGDIIGRLEREGKLCLLTDSLVFTLMRRRIKR